MEALILCPGMHEGGDRVNSALLKIQKPLGLLSAEQRGRRDWLVGPQKAPFSSTAKQ